MLMLRVCKKRCLFYLLDLRIVSIIGVGNEFKILPRLMSRVRIPSPAPIQNHLVKVVFFYGWRFKPHSWLSTDGIVPVWLVSSFYSLTRCGHSVCSACGTSLSLVCKRTNIRLSSENNSPDCFLSFSPLQFETTL